MQNLAAYKKLINETLDGVQDRSGEPEQGKPEDYPKGPKPTTGFLLREEAKKIWNSKFQSKFEKLREEYAAHVNNLATEDNEDDYFELVDGANSKIVRSGVTPFDLFLADHEVVESWRNQQA